MRSSPGSRRLDRDAVVHGAKISWYSSCERCDSRGYPPRSAPPVRRAVFLIQCAYGWGAPADSCCLRADDTAFARGLIAVVVHHALAADLLLINGRILTMDSHDTVSQAVAVRDGKIVAVGVTAEVEELAGASTQVIDLDGRTAIPGLTDCHVHLASDSSRAVESVECRDLYDASMDSVEALMTRIGQWATSTPPGEWIVARGSPLADFRLHERRLPTRAELDYAAPRNPTYISFGAHVIIASTLALRERGVTRDTPSPQGGTVVKDAVTGEPTGELRERAQFLVKRRDGEIDPTRPATIRWIRCATSAPRWRTRRSAARK